MHDRDHPLRRLTPHLPFLLLSAMLVILWLAGGASRGDVIGQAITRAAAFAILIAAILFVRRPMWGPIAPVAILVFAVTLLAASHLVPLPPSLWTHLPGRELVSQAAIVSGQDQPWRPLSISPGATANALSSLVVPVVMLILLSLLSLREHWRSAKLLLALVVCSTMLALLQFSGGRFDHPLINDVPGAVSASFANRNHFALFAAIGCILAPAWAFGEPRGSSRWRSPAAAGLLLLFALIILASGSRMGLILGALGIGIGLFSVRRQMADELRRLPRWASRSLVIGAFVLVAVFLYLSVALNRAASLDRFFSLGVEGDLRQQALPTILDMIGRYFPFGTGFGTFDPAFRIHEPSALLKISYLNHAHNDLIEVVLDGGLPALLLLAAGIAWWLWASYRAWRLARGSKALLPRLGSGILLLVLLGSITDYPARTPMIMGVIVMAAVWLSQSTRGAERDVREAG